MNAARPASWPKLARFRGDTTRLPFRLTDERGAVYNPTGRTLICTVKADPTAADTAALIQKISAVGGIYVTDAAAGLIEVELVPADYDGLTVGSTYQVDVQGQDAATGAVRTVGRATLTIADDVTKGTTLAIPTTTTNPAAGFTWSNITGTPSALTQIAALTPAAGDMLQSQAGQWAARTIAQIKADLALQLVDNTADLAKPVSAAQAAADTAVGSAAAADATAKANAAIAIAAADATAKANAAQAASQPLDPTLTAFAAIATAADKLIYATGADAFAACDLTATGRSLIASASAAAARTTLGLGAAALGTLNYGSGADTLAVLAGNITATKKFLAQAGTGAVSAAPAWSTLVAGDIPDLSATYQPLSAALTAFGQVATNGGIFRTAAGTYTARTLLGTDGQIDILNADGAAGNPVVALSGTITLDILFTSGLKASMPVRFETPGGDNVTLSGRATTDDYYFGVNYFDANGLESVKSNSRGSWRTLNRVSTAPVWGVDWRAANAAVSAFTRLLTLGTNGDVVFTGTTTSTSTTTGALTVPGGVGVGGAVNASGGFGLPTGAQITNISAGGGIIFNSTDTSFRAPGQPSDQFILGIGTVSVGSGSVLTAGANKYAHGNGVTWSSGAGSPEGIVTAQVGSFYSRTGGGAVSTLYVKESGIGATGWIAK